MFKTILNTIYQLISNINWIFTVISNRRLYVIIRYDFGKLRKNLIEKHNLVVLFKYL